MEISDLQTKAKEVRQQSTSIEQPDKRIPKRKTLSMRKGKTTIVQPEESEYTEFHKKDAIHYAEPLEELKEASAGILLSTDVTKRSYDRIQQRLDPMRDAEKIRLETELAEREAAIQAFNDKNPPTTLGAAFDANMALENFIIAPSVTLNVPMMPDVQGYDPLVDENLEGYEEFVDEIAFFRNPAQVQIYKDNIDRLRNHQRTIANSSLPVTILSSVGSGLVNPMNLAYMLRVPNMIAKASLTAKLGYGSAIGVTTQSIEEVLLHDQQSTRTLSDSALNVTANALVDGVLGGTYIANKVLRESFDRSKAIKEAKIKLRDEQIQAYDEFSEEARSVGAMQAQESPDVELQETKGITGWVIGKPALFLARATPLGRGLQSRAQTMRNATAGLAETNIATTNKQGVIAAESFIKADMARLNQTNLDVDAIEKQFIQEAKGNNAQQFNDLLDEALRFGDVSENELVTQAAQRIRGFYNDMWNRAAAARVPGTFDPETGKPLQQATARTYQTRVYDRKAIHNDYQGFLDAVQLGLKKGREQYNFLNVKVPLAKHRMATEAQVKEIKTYLSNAPTERKNLVSLVTNKETAIKGNSREIGRLKAKKGDTSRIAALEKKIKELEKDKKAIQKKVKQFDLETKAKRKELSDINAKEKDILSRAQRDFDPEELKAASVDFYQGVMNLKEGEPHFAVEPNISITKHRTQLLDEYVLDYLEKDWRARLNQIGKSLSGRTRMSEFNARSGGELGDTQLTGVMNNVKMEYFDLIEEAAQKGDNKLVKKLQKELNGSLKDIEGMRDRLLLKSFEKDPDSPIQVTMRSVLNFNASRMLNGMVISSIPEIAKFMATRGITDFINGVKFQKLDVAIKKLPKNHAASMASASYRAQGIHTAMATDLHDMAPTNILERGSRGLAHITNYISGQRAFDSYFKTLSGLITGDNFAKAARKMDDKAIAELKKAGFNDAEIKIIGREIKKHYTEVDGLADPQIDKWDLRSDDLEQYYRPEDLIDKYDAMTIKAADTAIVQPGVGDRPLFMDSTTARTIFQFKTFILGATNRTFVPLGQVGDAQAAKTMSMMSGAALLSYMTYMAAAGREINWDDKGQLTKEILDRGGFLGYAMELNNMSLKATGLGIGKPSSKWQARNDLGGLLGPTFGTMQDFMRMGNVKRDPETGEVYTEVGSRIKAAMKLLPFNNHWAWRQQRDALSDYLSE